MAMKESRSYSEGSRLQDESLSFENEKASVKAVVRIRPTNDHEDEYDTCIHALSHEITDDSSSQESSDSQAIKYETIQVGEDESNNHSFTFDHVFPPSTNQTQVYSDCVKSLVEACLEGYNATVFAYGQTGSGKTHTIIGDLHHRGGNSDEKENRDGVIPKALWDIFRGLEEKSNRQQETNRSKSSAQKSKVAFEYEVQVEFLELYEEEIHDLIVTDSEGDNADSPRFLREMDCNSVNSRTSLCSAVNKGNRLIIRDGKPGEDAEVIGARRVKVQSAEEALEYLWQGLDMRRTERTAMNTASSRSHAIFTLLIQQTQRDMSVTESSSGGGRTRRGNKIMDMKTSKIHFVDLAGSERIRSAKTQGKRMSEGISINKGLFALGNVISALGSTSKPNKTHVPFRDSKLTRLLKGSLGGNHKTLMIACVSPSVINRDESTNTLRYANRAKNIRNHAKVNVHIDPSTKLINDLKEKVTSLATELLRVQKNEILNENSCPFSEDYLKDLIRLSFDSRKPKICRTQKKIELQLESRPSTAPDPLKSKCDDNLEGRLKLVQSNDDLHVLDELTEVSSECSQGTLEKDEQVAFYGNIADSLHETLNAVTSTVDNNSTLSNEHDTLNECFSEKESQQSYQAVKLENKFKLVETKLQNHARELDYIENFLSQTDVTSVQSAEITKSVIAARDEIAKLQKERVHFLELIQNAPIEVAKSLEEGIIEKLPESPAVQRRKSVPLILNLTNFPESNECSSTSQGRQHSFRKLSSFGDSSIQSTRDTPSPPRKVQTARQYSSRTLSSFGDSSTEDTTSILRKCHDSIKRKKSPHSNSSTADSKVTHLTTCSSVSDSSYMDWEKQYVERREDRNCFGSFLVNIFDVILRPKETILYHLTT